MLLDSQLKFSDAQALTVTAISSNVVDLRNQSTPTTVDEAFTGEDVWLEIHVITAAAGGDAAKTTTFSLESSAAVGLTSATVHYTSAAITGAAQTAGAVPVRIKLPSGDYLRYLGVRYTCSATFTSYTVTAVLIVGTQRNTIYPVGFSVS